MRGVRYSCFAAGALTINLPDCLRSPPSSIPSWPENVGGSGDADENGGESALEVPRWQLRKSPRVLQRRSLDRQDECVEDRSSQQSRSLLSQTPRFQQVIGIRIASPETLLEGKHLNMLHQRKMKPCDRAVAECTSVLELNFNYTGALMLRAQTLVALKEYQCALFDVNRLLELASESEVYLNLQSRLKTQLSLAPIPALEGEEQEEEDEVQEDNYEEESRREVIFGIIGEEKIKEVHSLVRPHLQTTTEASSSCNGRIAYSSDSIKKTSDHQTEEWDEIPKPSGHSRLDYSRWDRIGDFSEEEDDDDGSDDNEDNGDDEDSQHSYMFRVRTIRAL